MTAISDANLTVGGYINSPAKGFDGRPELRELVHEQCGFLQLHAECAQRFASIGDDTGLRYSIAKIVAYACFAGETYADLHREVERIAALERPAA